jgi:hypothetical protein
MFEGELYEIIFLRKTMVGNNWSYEKLCKIIGVMKISVK